MKGDQLCEFCSERSIHHFLSNDLSIVESMTEFFSSVFTSEDCDNFPEFEYVTNSKLSDILCDTKEVEKLLKN